MLNVELSRTGARFAALVVIPAMLIAGCGESSGGGDGADNNGNGDGGGSSNLSAFSNPTYFIGNDGSSGNTSDGSQLWKTDGTESGTQKVKAVAPGEDADIEQITPVGDKVFFIADDNEGYGQQLWVSDGTESGTLRLTDSTELDAGTATTLSEFDGMLYFRGRSESGEIWIWKSDGTIAGTGPADTDVTLDNGLSLLTPFKNHLYFRANDGTNGAELWRSDGTDANTEMVADIQTDGGLGSLFTCTEGFVELDGMLYFSANDGSGGGCDLWRTNGELGHAEKVKEMSDSFNTGPIDLVVADDTLFFLTRREPATGTDDGAVWVSDGTDAGTTKVFDEDDDEYRVMMGSSGPTGISQPLLAAGDHAYFYVNPESVILLH